MELKQVNEDTKSNDEDDQYTLSTNRGANSEPLDSRSTNYDQSNGEIDRDKIISTNVCEDETCTGNENKIANNIHQSRSDQSEKTMSERDRVSEEVDYDQLVSAAGEFGLYQVILIFINFPFYIFGVFAYFGQLFLTEASPNHWCWVPELENMTASDRRSLAIPSDENARFGYSQCEMFAANWSEVLSSGGRPNASWPTQACLNGWEFNKTEIPYPTITSEMFWICDKASYQATAQAIFFVGCVVGGFFIGWLSDRFGRIPAAVASNVIGCVAGILSIFVRDFTQFCICRFLMGLSNDYCMMMTYLLTLELVAPKYRSLMANLPFGVFFSLGATALPWIALACGHWKTLSLAMSIPMGFAVLTPLVMPESPRWLLFKGRVDEAVELVVRIARVNKKEVPKKLIQKFKASASKKESDETGSLLDLVTRPILRKIFICLCVEYMCCMTAFDALVRSINGLQFDFFISFTLVSLTECPSLILVSLILDRTGRKWLSIPCLSLCGVFSVMTPFIGAGLPSVMCAVAARFCVNMSTNIALQWGAEMLPTPVRGAAVSFIHICGFVASILSPYIAYLENYVSWLPLVIVGGVTLVGAAAASALPETVGRDMPQTFADAEVLSRDQGVFEVPCLQRFKAKPNGKVEGHVNECFDMN